jgi:archaellum component FlaC
MEIGHLNRERERIEEEIRKVERREMNKKLADSMKKLDEITRSLATLQESLNAIWKRTEQLKEDIKSLME